MKKQMLILAMMIVLSVSLVHGETTQDKARKFFFIAGGDPCRAEELLEVTGMNNSGLPIMLAYEGAAYTILADCIKSPFKKLKNFNHGKEMIEEAIILDPEDPEIRFIRFMVQDGAPAFLNYDNRKEDLKIIIRAFEKFSVMNGTDDFRRKMAEAVSASEYPEDEQKSMITGFMKN